MKAERIGKDTAIASFHRHGIKTIMLTGDNAIVAQEIVREAGIDDARAEQKPENKLSAIKKLQAQGEIVAIIGDGINDSPALAQADKWGFQMFRLW